MKQLGLCVSLLLLPMGAQAQGLNPLPLIAQFESSFNPTAQNPTPGSTASGLYGDVNATWASALSACGGGCGTIRQYPTAASAPASVQTAANAALINQNGLRDWLCSGCDAKFTNAVNAAGGAGAFQTSGLSADPATYSSMDTPAGLRAFQNSTMQSDGSQVVSATPGTTATITTVIPSPFSDSYSYVQQQLIPAITAAAAQAVTMVSAVAIALIVIMGALKSWEAFDGAVGFRDFAWFAFRCIMVLVLLGTGTFSLQGTWTPFITNDMPNWIGGIGGGAGINPAAEFDTALFNFWLTSSEVLKQTPGGWDNIPQAIGVAFTLAIYALILIGVLIALFLPLILVQTALALVAGPVLPFVAPAILFRSTSKHWVAAVATVVVLILATLMIDLFAAILAQALARSLQNITVTNPWSALWSLGSAIIKVVLVGLLIPVGFGLAKVIGGAGIAVEASNPVRAATKWMGG